MNDCILVAFCSTYFDRIQAVKKRIAFVAKNTNTVNVESGRDLTELVIGTSYGSGYIVQGTQTLEKPRLLARRTSPGTKTANVPDSPKLRDGAG